MATTWSLRQPLANRVSWGALFAGFFFGFGIWLLLLALGAGIGLATFDPKDVSNWQGLGVGFGIWGVIAGIIAMFLAGWLAARLSATDEKASGMLHGLAVWGLMIVAGLWIATMAVGRTAGAAAQIAGGAAQAAGQAASDPQARSEASRQAENVQQQAKGAIADARENAGEIGQTAATAGTAGAWGFFLYGLLTLVASAVGGGAGVPKDRRVVTHGEPAPAPGAPYSPQRA